MQHIRKKTFSTDILIDFFGLIIKSIYLPMYILKIKSSLNSLTTLTIKINYNYIIHSYLLIASFIKQLIKGEIFIVIVVT